MRRTNVLYYGIDAPLPGRIPLRAGPLRMFFESGDLRTIQYAGVEVLRRVYVAIRDRNWGTLPNVLSDIRIDVREDSFEITYQAANQAGAIDFRWQMHITGEVDGTITFGMDGTAHSTFLSNRIGFCVLHPAACAGVNCRVEHLDGSESRAELPYLIDPVQPVAPFYEMRALSHQVQGSLWARVQFDGGNFEMEDQRNWTDASFKSFSPPLRLPFPVEVKEGTRINQSIRLSLEGEARPTLKGKETGEASLELTLEPSADPLPLPPVGLCCASHRQALNQNEIARLKALHLDHLRVDLHPEDPALEALLRQATIEARALGAKLDVALFISAGGEGLAELSALVRRMMPPVRAWLIYPAGGGQPGADAVANALAQAHRHLTGAIGGAQFASGADADLILLQRAMPPLEQVDLVTFAITPQVHAFDQVSIIETLEAQPRAVQTARQRAAGKPVMVSPVTLRQRHNPFATGAELPPAPGELPPQVDPRQMSLFGAAWTLGCLGALAGCGTASLTFYETTGWRGVMETTAGSPNPERFQTLPGEVFPLYHVLAAAGAFAGGEVIPTRATCPQQFTGLALRKGRRERLLLAGLAPFEQTVSVELHRPRAICRRLDETNVEEAMRRPESFMHAGTVLEAGANGRLAIDLLPYAFACLDFSD